MTSVDFDAWHGLPVLIMMVALLAVWSTLSWTSKVMLGSIGLEEPSGKTRAVFWAGSGVHWSGYMPSSNAWALATVLGLCGGRDTLKFLLMDILGGGSCFISTWFPWPREQKKNKKKVNPNGTNLQWNVFNVIKKRLRLWRMPLSPKLFIYYHKKIRQLISINHAAKVFIFLIVKYTASLTKTCILNDSRHCSSWQKAIK